MKLGLRQKLLVSVFVSAAALAAAQHAMAATIHVNPGESIQAAVNAASAGDIIVIAAGTYTENVTINKALTFQGANFGVSGNATRGAESTINGAFTVASNNITIDGLRFNGGASAVKGESAANAYDNLVIQNNLIQNTTDSAIRLGLGTGGGIGSDNWTISNNKIENITGNSLTGMVLFNVTGLTVTNNVVNHDAAGSTGRRGINLDGVQNATVTGNTINMGLVDPTDPFAASSAAPWIIQVSMSDREVSDVNISNNSVSGAYRGITPLSQRTITNLDISGNTVSNVIQGIVLNTGSTAPQSTGVTFDVDVIGNTITTTTAGTGTFTCGTGCAIYVRDLHDAHPNGPIVFSNLDITANTIIGGPIQVGGTETFVSGSGAGNGLVNLSGFVNIQGGAGANTEGTFTAPANPGYISQTSGSNIVVGSGATVTGQDDNGNTLTASGGSTVELGDNTTISGNTLVGAGGSVEGGTTGSPYVITGNTEVQAGGTLGGNGDLSGSLLNGGNVGPGNSPGIINVGSYVGAGGILTMEADLASLAPGAGTTFDQLNVAGNVTGTSTSITLTQVNPGTAVPTTGLGMALVTVGGSVSSNAFTMSQFIANGYTFSLRYRQDYAGTTDGFFLVSGHCQTSGLADVCLVDSTTDLLVPIDAQGGTDTLQLGGASDFSFDLASVGPVFQNFEALEKTGSSNVTLTGTNTLTGGVTVTGGTLTASGGSAINDASAVSVASGATLALSASETIGSLAGAGSVSMGANNLTTGGNNTSTAFSGAISGAGSVTKVGTGTMTLSGTNTFTGGLLINAGTVATSGTTAIADTNAVSIASGGTLTLGAMAPGTFEIVGGLNMAAGSTLNVTSAGTGLVVGDLVDSAIAGTVNSPFAGFLLKAGPATMTVDGLTMAEGDFYLIGGVTAHTSGTSTIKAPIVGTGTGYSAIFAMSGGTLNVTGTCVLPGDSGCARMSVGDFGGTGVVNHTGGTIKVAGTVGVSPASFAVGNQGGDGTYNISGGVLQFGDAADPVNSGLWGVSRSTSSATDATTNGTLNISGTGLVDVQTGDLVNGDRDSTGFAGGETTLSTINMTGGELRVGASAEFFLAAFDNNAAVDSIFNLNGGQLTIGGASLQEYYAGGTGVYQFNFGNGTIMVSGSALTTTADATLTGATQLTGATLNTNGLGATWSGDLTGTGWLTKAGAGTLTLSGTNTFSGGLAVNAGEVSLLGGAALADALAVTVASGATLSLGANETIGSLAGAGAVGLGANTLTAGGNNGSTTFSGAMSGTGGLTKAGTGTMTLSGANTYTGATTINAGTLATAGGAAIADTSAVTVASGATLSLGANETVASIAGAGSVGLGAFTLTSGGDGSSTALSGAVTGTGGLTKLGAGTLTLSGANTYSGATTISAGTLATSGGAAIGDASAVTVASGATLSLGANETIGGLSGAGSVVLGANTLTSGSGAFTGTTAGTGGLTKAGAGTLSTGALAHTGLTTVSGGTLNVNGSTAGSVLVNSGGTLSGNTAIGGNLTLNAGGALSSGNSPGTTTVAGNFTGGGILNVEVQFSNAAAPVNGTTHDFLNITGNVTGVSTINILAVAPSTPAALTTGNGIELVRVGGTTSASAFVLGGPVVQGGVQYLLSYLPNYSGSLDGYFLQSTARDEIAGHAAMLASSRTLLARCHRGEERNSAQGAVAGGKRAWAKYGTGSIESGADTGLQMDQDYTCTAGGIDLASGADLRLGLVGGFGSTEVDITTLAGVSRLDGDLGLIEAQAAYAKDGMFVNLSAGYATTDWTHTGTVSGVKAATVDGLVGSLMVGRQWALGTEWQLGVSGEINYDGTTCSDACILAGVTAEESNWRAGLGAKLAGTMPAFRPFVSVSWSDDLDGGNTVSLGTVSVAADTAASLLGARAGFEANLSEKIGLFADVGMVEGLDTSVSGVDGQAGLRIFW